MLTAGCASSAYVEKVTKDIYLVDVYRLPDKQSARLGWQEKINEICKGNVLKDDVTITLETHDRPNCESCGFRKSSKIGTYTAWGKVQCQPE